MVRTAATMINESSRPLRAKMPMVIIRSCANAASEATANEVANRKLTYTKIPSSPSARARALFVASSFPTSAPTWSVCSNFRPAVGKASLSRALILSAAPESARMLMRSRFATFSD